MRRFRHLGALLSTTLLLLAGPADLKAQAEHGLDDVQPVSRDAVVRAMLLEREKGYDLTASTNATRLWAHTIFMLAEWAKEAAPDGSPLFLHEADYYHAYLEATGLDAAGAPEFIRISHEYGQHTLIEYRLERIVDMAETETIPARALAVRTWWPESGSLGDRYSFEDTLSTPRLLVVNEREVSYRLLDFGDQMLFDRIEGIRGRPTSGVLGVLFEVLGTGRIVWSRMAVSDDGSLVVRAKAKKLVSKTSTAVVERDGTGGDVPDDRTDLRVVAERLERPLEVAYQPWPF
jgi:hypothetical protein